MNDNLHPVSHTCGKSVTRTTSIDWKSLFLICQLLALINVQSATISLSLSKTTVSEANEQLTATITRGGNITSALTVVMTSSDPSALQIPSVVTVAAHFTTAQFTITTINNGTVEGTRNVNILATAGADAAQQTLTVTDDDTAGRMTIGGPISGTLPPRDYEVLNNLTVAAGRILTISPGARFLFAPGVGLTVSGRLSSTGTSASNIVFTSRSVVPTPGDWSGITFRGSGEAFSLLRHTTVSYAGTGVLIDRDDVRVRIEDSRILSNSGNGISISLPQGDYIFSDDVSILRNEIAGNLGNGISLSCSSSSGSLLVSTLAVSSRISAPIEENNIHHNTIAGIRMNPRGFGSSSSPVRGTAVLDSTIQKNRLHANGIGITGEVTSSTGGRASLTPSILNNLIYSNLTDGVECGSAFAGQIVNNTIHLNAAVGVKQAVNVSPTLRIENNNVVDNPIGFELEGPLGSNPMPTIRYNNVFSSNGTPWGTHYPSTYGLLNGNNFWGQPIDAHSNMGADPQFALAFEYVLMATSPLINAASPNSAPPRDFFGKPRSGGTPDIGTHEFLAAPTILSLPTAVVGTIGQVATVQVTTLGDPPILYQWLKDGVQLANETNSVLNITNFSVADEGNYQVMVGNLNGAALSEPVVVSQTALISIDREPVGAVVDAGAGVAMGVLASSDEPIDYQWYKDEIPLIGETKNVLFIIVSRTNDSGVYRVSLSNRLAAVSSIPVTVTVNPVNVNLSWLPPAPIRYGTPLSAVHFQAVVVGGVPGTMSYDPPAGTILPVGRHSLKAIFVPTDVGFYSSETNIVPIDVTPAPLTIRAVSAQRASNQPNPTFGITFSGFVNNDGTNALRQQPTVSTFAIPSSLPGAYPLTVSGAAADNYAISYINGTLVVNSDIPLFSQSPANQSIALGNQVELSVSVVGTPPFSYQWRKEGVPIIGATNRTFQISSVTVSDRGHYDVAVTNDYGSAVSESALLSFSGPPAILTDLTNITVIRGTELRLNVGVTGAEPLRFDWYQLISKLPYGGSELIIPNVQPAHAGFYSVAVRKSLGFDGSSVVKVTVVEPTQIDMLSIDPWVLFGKDMRLSATVDGHAPFVFQWHKDGVPLPGASNSSLWISNAVRADAGRYQLMASNQAAATYSSNAYLRIRVPQRMLKPERPANDRFQLRFGAADGQGMSSGQLSNLVIQASPDFINWFTLSTNGSNLISTNGETLFDDTGVSGRSHRYYRILEQ